MAVTTAGSMTVVVMTMVIAEMTPVVTVLVTRAGPGSCKGGDGGVGRW